MKDTQQKDGVRKEKKSWKERIKGLKERVQQGEKKKLVLIGSICVLIIAGLIVGILYISKSERQRSGWPQMPEGMFGMGEDVLTVSGLTTVGMTVEDWELDFLETQLYIEESYLSVGETVEEGTAVFKVSDESLETAREELEKAQIEKELAYRQGKIDYEIQKLEVESTWQKAEINKEYAQAEYDNSLTQVKQTVENLKTQVEEAQALYNEYKAAVESNYYYTYYQVEELQQVYYDNFSFLMELYEKWDIEGLRDHYPNYSQSIGQSSGGIQGISNQSGVNGQTPAILQTTTASSLSGSGDRQLGQEQPEEMSGIIVQSLMSFSEGKSNSMGTTEAAVAANKDISGKTDTTEDETDTPGETNTPDGQPEGGNTATDGNQPAPGGSQMPEGMQGAGGSFSSGSGGRIGGSFTVDEEATKLTVYEMMVALVDENAAAYEAAVENYEQDTRTAQISLEAARSKLATLQAELKEAELAYEKQVIASKTTYDTTTAESESAEEVYKTSMSKLEEELEVLLDASEEAEERVKIFEETMGDGLFYTKSGGTIVMNRVRGDSYLSGAEGILAYSNPETVTVAASVNQEDISKVEVGEEAYVSVSEYGWYEGTIVSVDPISSSGSRSSVTYTVTVELSGDISTLESNLTAYVYIGMPERQSGEAPQGMPERQSGEAPQGMPERQSGEAPEGMLERQSGEASAGIPEREVPEEFTSENPSGQRMAGNGGNGE